MPSFFAQKVCTFSAPFLHLFYGIKMYQNVSKYSFAFFAVPHKKYGKMLKNAQKWLKINKKGFEIVIFTSLFQSLNLAQKERFELFYFLRVSRVFALFAPRLHQIHIIKLVCNVCDRAFSRLCVYVHCHCYSRVPKRVLKGFRIYSCLNRNGGI